MILVLFYFFNLLLAASVQVQEASNVCHPNQFQCKLSKICIKRDQVRNEVYNCGPNDTSDEDEPLARCQAQTEFRCRGNGQCIPRGWINREIYLCSDASDDGGIPDFPCSRNTEFKCRRGSCIARHLVNDGFSDCSPDDGDENTSTMKCDPETEFECSPGRCIKRKQVRDGRKECKNGKDEDTPLNCTDVEYKCNNGRCIPNHAIGDQSERCGVEGRRSIYCSHEKEFPCYDNSGDVIARCIPRAWVNDGVRHCQDGSDEKVTSLKCIADEWSCDNGMKCLPSKLLCDGIPDCADCSDETDPTVCSQQDASRFFTCTDPIDLGDSQRDGKMVASHCILRSRFCDGTVDCAYGSDELYIGHGFKCRVTKLSKGETRTCSLPDNLLNDGVADCDDSSDENQEKEDRGQCFFIRGIEERKSIKKSQICDGIIDCPNLSDECLCQAILENNPNHEVIARVCRKICFHSGRNHTSVLSSSVKQLESRVCNLCSIGEVLCDVEAGKPKCINTRDFCDGVKNCFDDTDEKYCRVDSPAFLKPIKNETRNFSCPLNEELLYFSKIYKDEIRTHAKLCDGVPECFGLADECIDADQQLLFCSHYKRPMYCDVLTAERWWNFRIHEEVHLPSHVCNGVIEWQNGVDEIYCNDTRFSCDVNATTSDATSTRMVSIELERICDGHVDCIDESDERNCPGYFYCAKSTNPSFISRSKVLDGRADCADGSDECPDLEAFGGDPMSSREELIKFPFLRGWIWFIAITSLIGNTMVISVTVKKILSWFTLLHPSPVLEQFTSHNTKRRASGVQHSSSLSKSNDVLVLNLALADLLTGVYLMAIAVTSIEYSGSYCTHETAWRSSKECENLGVLVWVSLQASMLIMVTLTSYRLLAVLRPWKVKECSIMVVLALVAFIWTLSIIIALLPTFNGLSDVFVTSALVTVNAGTVRSWYFPSKVVSKETVMSFLKKLCVLTYDNKSIHQLPICNDAFDEGVAWASLVEGLESSFTDTKISGYFGFYSSHGVCLPSVYPLNNDQSLRRSTTYTVFLITLAFLSFTYIALAYLIICCKSARQKPFRGDSTNNITKSVPDKRLAKMHRKIGRLILTDFVCWIPICLTALCGFAGVSIPAQLYSFTVAVLLPINSALNPILYSEVISSCWSCLAKKRRPVNTAAKSSSNVGNTTQMNTETTPNLTQYRRRSSSKTEALLNARKLSLVLNQSQQNNLSFSKSLRNVFAGKSTADQSSNIHSSAESLHLSTRLKPTAVTDIDGNDKLSTPV